MNTPTIRTPFAVVVGLLMLSSACKTPPPTDRVRVSGQIEATDVQVASQVPGRLLHRAIAEGQRVEKGAVVATLDVADTELSLNRAKADRAQAEAQLRLLQAGARAEDVRQAEAQVVAAQSDVATAEANVADAQSNLDTLKQGADPLDITADKLSLQSALIDLEEARNNLAHARIVAPISGTVMRPP